MPSVELRMDGVGTLFSAAAHDEEKLFQSWKVLTKAKDAYANGSRLENASWRLWYQKRNNIKTLKTRKYLSPPPPALLERFDLLTDEAVPILLTKLALIEQDRQQPRPLSPENVDTGDRSDDSSICSESTAESTAESLLGQSGLPSDCHSEVVSGISSPVKKRKCVRFDDSLNRTAFLCDDESDRFDGAVTDELSDDETDNFDAFIWEYSDSEDEATEPEVGFRHPLISQDNSDSSYISHLTDENETIFSKPMSEPGLEAYAGNMVLLLELVELLRWCAAMIFISQIR